MRCISLKLLVASTLLNLLLMPLSSMFSILFGYIALLSSVVLPFELLKLNNNCTNRKQIRIVLALVIILCVNSIFSLTSLSLGELENVVKAFVSFVSFMVAISVRDGVYTENDLKFYFSLTRIFSVVMIFYTIIPFDFQYVIVNEYGNVQFTLSMGNPNATAAKVLFAIVLLCIENGALKRKLLKCINAILILGMLYCILMLQSRTALFSALLVVAYSAVMRFRVKKWMTTWVWVLPVAFIPVQILLAKYPIWNVLDKSVASGRETMYMDFYEILSSSPWRFISGNFIENQLANGHNIIFTIIFNFGIAGLVLFFAFWRIESARVGSTNTKLAQYAWIGWMVYVVHSMAEAAALSGSFTFGVIIILLNRMTKDKMIPRPEYDSIYDNDLISPKILSRKEQ